MTKDEIIWTASVAFAKNLDYETLKYSDYMYDNEEQTDDVWKYVTELRENGVKWFYDKYKEYKLF